MMYDIKCLNKCFVAQNFNIVLKISKRNLSSSHWKPFHLTLVTAGFVSLIWQLTDVSYSSECLSKKYSVPRMVFPISCAILKYSRYFKRKWLNIFSPSSINCPYININPYELRRWFRVREQFNIYSFLLSHLTQMWANDFWLVRVWLC